MQNETNNIEQQDLNEILKVRRAKLADLKAENKNPFDIVKFDVKNYCKDLVDNFDDTVEQYEPIAVAGRIMSKRVMGKASFANVLDTSGNIQLYIKRDVIGQDEYADFKQMDIGDIVGVEGNKLFRTKTGEISIEVSKITLLAKSLQPLPEKFHGLKDPDLRYRQRYVDMIVNPEVKETFIKRSKIITAMRRLLDDQGFLEVETPILNNIPGGASARPFITHHNTLDIDMYLRIATELHLKRLIVGGLDRVYEIGRLFRNEGMDHSHNPEFTTIELYQAYTDYHGMMDICEKIIVHCCNSVNGTTKINYQGTDIDLTPPYRRITMNDAVKEYAGVDIMGCETDEQARELAKQVGMTFEDKDITKGKVLNELFEAKVEEKLIQPTFIMDYPVEVSPLTKAKPGNEMITERFELFINADEFGNAYSELNDPIVQRERFMQQMKEREKGDDEAQLLDEDFCLSLEYGMPPTGGIGIGIDRLVMLLTDSASVRDVLLFPTMKPKN